MKKKGHTPVTKVKNPEPNIDLPDWIVWPGKKFEYSRKEITSKIKKNDYL